MFVPYGLITRVTVSMWHPSQRRIGFTVGGDWRGNAGESFVFSRRGATRGWS
jgi:hypothetical protein